MSLYALRLYGTNHFFAGFKPTGKVGVFDPAFVEPGKEKHVQVNIIHIDDLPETENDLKKMGITTTRIHLT
jgi:hypothetical protein